ncbi:MAG TPA: catalase family peroxidase [Pararobbsia sp.]|nr:catalase family peroxidase [Pararobbsia sp.]
MANRMPPGRPGANPPQGGALALRLAAIGACVIVPALAFAYVGGWLTPSHLSAGTIIDALQVNGGDHPGYRRNHAKGACVVGYFQSNGALAAYSTAQVFETAARSDLVGRLAIPGGNPYAPDSSAPVRSFALRFTQADGQQWRTGMNDIPVFPVATPKSFYEQLVATRPDPVTHKPDADKVKAFFASHPETNAFRAWAKTAHPSASFATETYYSLNAFYLVDQAGERHAVRWETVPETTEASTAGDPNDANYLIQDLTTRLAKGPLRWHLVFQFADPDDTVDNATIAWPATRRSVDAGTIVVEREQSQEDGPCRDINYDPTVLPSGMTVSTDPLLAARSAAYAKSYELRTSEETQAPGFEAKQAH